MNTYIIISDQLGLKPTFFFVNYKIYAISSNQYIAADIVALIMTMSVNGTYLVLS